MTNTVTARVGIASKDGRIHTSKVIPIHGDGVLIDGGYTLKATVKSVTFNPGDMPDLKYLEDFDVVVIASFPGLSGPVVSVAPMDEDSEPTIYTGEFITVTPNPQGLLTISMDNPPPPMIFEGRWKDD